MNYVLNMLRFNLFHGLIYKTTIFFIMEFVIHFMVLILRLIIFSLKMIKHSFEHHIEIYNDIGSSYRTVWIEMDVIKKLP
jgi:hypothetical protein